MPRYTAITALRARLAGIVPSVIKPAAPLADHFPDSTWQAERRIRECVDALIYPTRWRVCWMPTEPGRTKPRIFFLKGTHAGVTRRAHAFFSSGTVVIEPAIFPDGQEFIDARLNTTGRTHA